MIPFPVPARVFRRITIASAMLCVPVVVLSQGRDGTSRETTARPVGRDFHAVLDVASTYQSNPFQLDSGVAPGRTDGANLFATASYRTRKTQFDLAAYAGLARSQQFASLNRESEGGQLSVARMFGPRIRATASGAVRSALALDLAYGGVSSGTAIGSGSGTAPSGTPGTGQGAGGGDGGAAVPGVGDLPLRTTRIRVDEGSVGMTAQLSARTGFGAAAQFAQTNYGANNGATGSRTGRTIAGQAKLTNALSPRLRMEWAAELSNTDGGYAGLSSASMQDASLTFVLPLGRFLVEFGGGITHVSSSQQPGPGSSGLDSSSQSAFGPSLGGGISRRSDRGYLTLVFEREATPAFGREAFLFSNNIGVSAARTLTASSQLSGNVQVGRSKTTTGPTRSFGSTAADLTYRQRILYGISLNSTGFVRQRENNGTFRDVGVTLSASVPLR